MIIQSEVSEAIREYYMPYAMKVITDRALPDVRDGLKPIARRILWTMWNNGLLHNKPRAKCGKVVGDILKIHNHGDSSVYNALSLLTDQNESLLQGFIDGEGAFGKIYSKDSPSAMRYTSARLNKFSQEMFKNIDKDIVKFIGEDKEHLQPLCLPNTFPNILIKPNSGVAVGEACNWCSFNLVEVCNLTQEYIKNNNINVIDYLTAPDFSTGGYIITSNFDLNKIYETGRGSFRLQAKYKYNEKENTIEVYEIPYNTTVEDIKKEITNLMKSDRLKEVKDVKDGTGYNTKLKKEEMGVIIEIKNNVNPNRLMKKLFKYTSLNKSFNCNFNCLVNYRPQVLGIKQILNEWLKFRIECVKESIKYDLNNKIKLLHFLKGLEKVLLNIDKAVEIIRYSKTDSLIINNLRKEFNIDEQQANDIANMKLKNINEQYINNKVQSILEIQKEHDKLKGLLQSEKDIQNIIIDELEKVKNNYGKARKTELLNKHEIEDTSHEDLVEDFNPTIVLTEQQYIKKNRVFSQSQKLKDDDKILQFHQCNNKDDLLLFTNKGNVLIRKVYELDEHKPSTYGDFLPNLLGEHLENDEKVIYISTTKDYKGSVISVFENGYIARTDLQTYKPKQNRQIPMSAYNTDIGIVSIQLITNDTDILLVSQEGKALIINTSQIRPTKSRNTQGVSGMKIDTETNKIIASIIGVTVDDNFNIETEKGKSKFIMLNDIAPNNKESMTDYLKGNRNTQGNFIYNTRQKNDRVIKLTKQEN
ncbi:DNA gyrase/topoisomerase IV subunit A [Clostridium botulinum]|uniref:DNA gyrase/topoisomerase IV subunit A n=1 Tax=Clostridium botulinum TaxID=1491 RepID=UPI0004D4FA26|nr:DNA topoisomerase (ATP-hydrolyzing) subunit A [Clostridium botulinum]KEH99795.1 putative DNA gyrase subunit A [Clostridium botulinum C/D str. BKT75002]KEI05273.1 putative DNA gyrase subunit A [Clostridium botulinum C/D str. BKT2873]QPW61963.1 DNA gyrase subunit A [Clostridium botulinum]